MPRILYSQCQFPKNQNNRFICPVCNKELVCYDNVNTLKKGGRKRFKANEKFCYLRCPGDIDHCNQIDIIKQQLVRDGYELTDFMDNRQICNECYSPLQVNSGDYLMCPECGKSFNKVTFIERKLYQAYFSSLDNIALHKRECMLSEDE